MKVYRYENKKDNGGPWFYKNGIARFDPSIHFDDKQISACISISALYNYFKKYKDTDISLKDYQIVEYLIPDDKIIQGYSHIYFLPQDVISSQPVSTIPDECKEVE